uniref:Uncharacterized protein n=1 Tax=Plectus sambesii TaxID=2011161 RepID=A0A914UT16_9BILA
MVVNGYARHSWELGWSCDEVPLRSAFSVGFGCLQDVQASTNFTQELSTILAFKGMISYQSAMVLRGLGPRCRTLADTKARTLEPSLYFMLKPNVVANHSPEMISLLEDRGAFIESLQKSLLFCVVPTEAKTFGVYVLQSVPEVTPPADTMSYLCLTRVKNFPIEWKCQRQSRQLTSLDDAFVALGGCRLFFLLFARMIDLKTSERAQAVALRLLFTAARRHTEWWHDFVGMKGEALVARCLSCPFAVVGQLMTFEIGTAAISGLEQTEMGELRANALAVIRDPELLCSLMCRATIWRGPEPFAHWVQLLHVLCSCVAETNSCGLFNRHQLVRVGFLKSLLQAIPSYHLSSFRRMMAHFQTCLEMFQDPLDYGPALGGSMVASAIVPLVASLLGDPEEVSRITELWDFLFLSHSASCTYLNYRIVGHNDWINLDGFQEEPINLLGRESVLAGQLRHYVHVLGQEQVSSVLKLTNGSVAAVKSAYESALAGKVVAIANPSADVGGQRHLSLTSSSDEDTSDACGEESSRPSSDSPIEQLVAAAAAAAAAAADRLEEKAAPLLRARDSFPALPDLVCDIDVDAAARDASTT